MNQRKNNPPDSWDTGLYGTGRTQPPKRHGGMVTFLLISVILLSGLVSALSMMNIKLFVQLNTNSNKQEDSLEFVSETMGTELTGDIFSGNNAQKPAPASDSELETLQLNPSPNSIPNIPQEGGMSLQEIYKKSIPSVVSISCTTHRGSSSGTGVILTESGYIVTNSHVIEGAGTITVQLTDGRSFTAALIGSDAFSDLAVLHIQAEELVSAEFGDSGALRVGDTVVAIGDPLGIELRGSMTNGIVSAINRNVTSDGRTLTLIQTNAALNSGNSGGPLINCYGQVIGINTLKIGAFTDSAGVEGLGFAIPSTTVKEIVEQLMEQGYVSGRPALGITGEDISSFYRYYYRLPEGLYITEVDPSSSAADAGIEPGDILMGLDGNPIPNMDTLTTLLYSYEAGDTVNVIIYRGGHQYSVTLTLQEARQ